MIASTTELQIHGAFNDPQQATDIFGSDVADGPDAECVNHFHCARIDDKSGIFEMLIESVERPAEVIGVVKCRDNR